MSNATELKQMVTSKEVMAYLGISRKTLYRYEQERGLPRYKLNRTTCRYDMDEVKAWAEERKEELYGLHKDLSKLYPNKYPKETT